MTSSVFLLCSWLDYFIRSLPVPLHLCLWSLGDTKNLHLEVPARIYAEQSFLCPHIHPGLQPCFGTGCLHFPERQHVSMVRTWKAGVSFPFCLQSLFISPRAPNSVIFLRNPGASAAPQLTCCMFSLSRTHPEPSHFGWGGGGWPAI